jgi:AhpD family alkylhydroperoxidase
MSQRLDYQNVDPAATAALFGMEKYVRGSSLDRKLINLLYIRVSQINGCAFCLDMHLKEAAESGENQQRLWSLSAWRETPFFEEHERAALALAEHITLVAEKGVPDDIYAEAARHFSQEQIIQLLMAITTINGWNRVSLTAGRQPVLLSESVHATHPAIAALAS